MTTDGKNFIEEQVEKYSEKGKVVDEYNSSKSIDELLVYFGHSLRNSACRIYLSLKIPKRGSWILSIGRVFSKEYYDNWHNGHIFLFVQSLLLVKNELLIFNQENSKFTIQTKHIDQAIMYGVVQYCELMNLNEEQTNLLLSILNKEIIRLEKINAVNKIGPGEITSTYEQYFKNGKKIKSREVAHLIVSYGYKAHIGNLNLRTFNKNYLRLTNL